MAKLFGSREKSSKKQEDIPDELPPLAEDSVVKKDEKNWNYYQRWRLWWIKRCC